MYNTAMQNQNTSAQPSSRSKKDTKALNMRLRKDEHQVVKQIAEREDRSVSEIVRFFIRWGIAHYKRVGSIQGLQTTTVLDSIHKLTEALRTVTAEQIREETRKDATLQIDLTGELNEEAAKNHRARKTA